MAVILTQDNRNLAETYDEVSDSQFNNGRLLLVKLDVEAGHHVLDIGCGTGRLGRYVADILGPFGSFTGIDPLEERVKIAKAKNRYENVRFETGVAEDLGRFAANSFDVVYLNAVFHWVLDKQTALREIFRVLRPGGKIGITTGPKELSHTSTLRVVTDAVLKREPFNQTVRVEESTHYQHGLTTTELVGLLSEVGFAIRDVQIRETERQYDNAQDFIRFTEASSFGNFLNHVPDSLREQAKAYIAAELEGQRRNGKIHFNRHTIYAVGQKTV